MVYFTPIFYYAVAAMTIASTIAAPLPNPEVGVRAIDDYEFEARDINLLALPFEERSELEERSHASNERAKHAFQKIGKVVTSILRRSDDDMLESRDLEERSHASNEKAKHAFQKIGKVISSILRRTDDDTLESRDSIFRRGFLGIAEKAVKGIVKGVEKLAHKKPKAPTPSAPQPQQTQSRRAIDESDYY